MHACHRFHRRLRLSATACAAGLSFAAMAAVAAEAPPAAATSDPAPGARAPLWEAGIAAFGGSQQAYPGSRQQVSNAIALPFLIYRGPILRAEQSGVGLRAVRTATTELDVGFAGSFGSSAGDSDARRGMPDIGLLVEAGPRLKLDLGEAPLGGRWRASLPLRAVFDVTHSLGYRGVAFEPELEWGRRSDTGWGYGAGLSLLFGNRRLTDTFYGVAPAYATAARPAYEASGGFIATRLGVNLTRRLSQDWRFFAYARVTSVAGAANRDSPLVDRTAGSSVGLGFSWTGLRSERPASP